MTTAAKVREFRADNERQALPIEGLGIQPIEVANEDGTTSWTVAIVVPGVNDFFVLPPGSPWPLLFGQGIQVGTYCTLLNNGFTAPESALITP